MAAAYRLGEGSRPGDLGFQPRRAAGLSLSGTTWVVNRLEGQGLLRRERCPGDGRGWHAVLTDAGSARLRVPA